MSEQPQRDSKKARGRRRAAAAAGLPEAVDAAEAPLRRVGIDPDRLPIFHFGRPSALAGPLPPWARRMGAGLLLWLLLYSLELAGLRLPGALEAVASLVTGLIILQAACEVLVHATEAWAARVKWDHYVAGTVAEILSTVPELVAIAFVVPVSPLAAFVIALITIYNNALVFSFYSFFLPKDQRGKFLMPAPMTEVGTQVLVAGAAIGFVIGLIMLAFDASGSHKAGFAAHDLTLLSLVLLIIFGVYLYKLVNDYAGEEEVVRETLDLDARDIEHRRELVYAHVPERSAAVILGLFAVGVAGSFAGGERVADFAQASLTDLGLNHILMSLILAVFAGMSEYVILWKAHRKREYGIALANAFGGITQVMFLVLPFTLLAIAFYQAFVDPGHPELPLTFTLSNILLLLFLFPTFFVLAELLEEDHTFSALDTTIMFAIVALLILLLVTYGAGGG